MTAVEFKNKIDSIIFAESPEIQSKLLKKLYKTMILKEETQQELHICKYCGAETTQSDDECYAKPKQETLEEATDRLQKDKYGIFISKDIDVKGQLVIDTARAAFLSGMTEGAKWQAERMFSDEEVIDLLAKFRRENRGKDSIPFKDIQEWFKKFKKK
jgi:hypothetical protein